MKLWNSSHDQSLEWAQKLDGVLGPMQKSIVSAADPQRLAMQDLFLPDNRFGALRTAYSERALTFWDNERNRNRNNGMAIHHLAVAHWARALDMEFGPMENGNRDWMEIDKDWMAGFYYWLLLLKNDSFWQQLDQLSRSSTATTEQLRQRLPKLLVALHYDIAFEKGLQNHRAQKHRGFILQVIKDNLLDEKVRKEVQNETYQRWIQSLPSEIWQHNVMDEQVIQPGVDHIEHFLKIDPDCIPALEDAVRLNLRLMQANATHFHAAGGEGAEGNQVIQNLVDEATRWNGYFKLICDSPELFDSVVRDQLANWYRLLAQSNRVMDNHENAASLYRNGKQVAFTEDMQKMLHKEYGDTMAYLARERAHQKAEDAREYCERAAGIDNLSIQAMYLTAQAFWILDDNQRALEICNTAIAYEPEMDILCDPEKLDSFNQVKEELLKLRNSAECDLLQHQAKDQMEQERYQEAIPLLEEAIHVKPEDRFSYFLLCQCALATYNPTQARQSLQTFKRCCEMTGSTQHDVIEHLEEQTAALEEGAERFGAEAFRHLQQSLKAYSDDNYDTAERELQAAHDCCIPRGRRNLQEQLQNLRAMRENQQRRQAFGEEVLLMRAQAAEAYRNDRYDEAIDLLRRAIHACPAAVVHDLEEELSIVLANKAVAHVNHAQENMNNPIQLLQSLLETRPWLQEAIQLDHNNDHAHRNLNDLNEILNNFGRH